MRWVFIRPRNRSPHYDPEIQEPLGLEYLAASRRAHAEPTLILDATLDGLEELRLGRRAAAFHPDVVGFSVTTASELDSVRQIYATCGPLVRGDRVTWLAGSNFVSTELPQAIRLLPSDFLLVPFEGEHALEDLAARPPSGPEPGSPAGSAPRILAGRAVEDLDVLPFPQRPFAEHVLQAGWAFNLQGSRGCCGCCRFCASPGMAADGVNRWRGRSPASLAEEIEELRRRCGAASFNIVDEDFLGPPALAPARAQQFAQELRRRRLRVSFGIQVRPASLGAAVIDTLTSVGLTYVFVGIESDDPADLRRWGRPWVPGVEALIDRLRQRGAAVHAGVMLFHPHATLAGIGRFARALHARGLLEFRSATNRLDAMPGSVEHREARAAGQIASGSLGPQPLPFGDPAVAELYRDLVLAAEPLGPPSMHAVCALPPWLARRWLEPHRAPTVQRLQNILAGLDEAVARTLFQLLERHLCGRCPPALVAALRQENFECALQAVSDLVREGFAPSRDLLREAIRSDAGM